MKNAPTLASVALDAAESEAPKFRGDLLILFSRQTRHFTGKRALLPEIVATPATSWLRQALCVCLTADFGTASPKIAPGCIV